MRCDDFRQQLAEYLRGELNEPLFGAMAEHEAECDACRTLAGETQAVASLDDEFDREREAEARRTVRPHLYEAPAELLDTVLSRTTGDDCLYMEQRLAERIEGPLPALLKQRLEAHLTGCASCRRLRDVLEELPSFYAAITPMCAGREFTQRVLRRTLGREPGFFEVVRELLRRPEAIWEAAVVCAFASMLIFSPLHTGPNNRAPGAAVEAGIRGANELLIDGLNAAQGRASDLTASGGEAIQGAWDGLMQDMTGASRWMEQTGADLRAGNTGGLFMDLDAALRSLHLLRGRPSSGPPGPGGQPGGGSSPRTSRSMSR